jgi:hypothetical protein
MGSPKATALGSKTITTPVAGGAYANKGDIIVSSASADGGHVVLVGHFVPTNGYRAGDSNDLVHWSLGPS